MFYAASANQDLITSKVNLFVACAPVTRMNGTTTSIKVAASTLKVTEGTLYSMSIYELFDTSTRNKLNAFMDSFTGKMLSSISHLISKAVSSTTYSNPVRSEAASNRFPNEASTKEVFHYG